VRILVTNDDGIEAPGLAAMYGTAERFGEVFVVAPAEPCSCCGHAITSGADMLVWREPGRRAEWYRVRGTPADCVRLAAAGVLGAPPDMVLSGINRGANLGFEVFSSGTVAAAREAACRGKVGIAVSQYVRSDVPVDWEWAADRAYEVVQHIIGRIPAAAAAAPYWNVNLPVRRSVDHRPACVEVEHDTLPLPLMFEEVADASAAGGQRAFRNRARYGDRPRSASGDVAALLGGAVTLTPLKLQTGFVDGPRP
jgi:5'-nucleotidase